MNVAFVIGHHRGSKGAFSYTLQKHEYDLFTDMRNDLSDIGDVFTHDQTISSYKDRQKAMANKTRNYDIVFELHFNSMDNEQYNGCEALYFHKNEIAKSYADRYCELVSEKLGVRSRGSKPTTSRKSRGGEFIFSQTPIAILLEPFFGSSPSDCEKWDPKKYISALKELVS